MDFNKVKKAFPNAVVNKTSTANTLINFLELPSDVKSWLLQKFTNEDGKLNAYGISECKNNEIENRRMEHKTS